MKFFSSLFTAAVLALIATAMPAMSQTIDLTGNGGLAIGGGSFDVGAVGNGSGSSVGTGTITERLSFSDSATLTTGRLTIDSNHNRTRVGFEGESYGGAAAQNTIRSVGVGAASSGAFSTSGVSGGMNYVGGGVNIQGSGSITLP